MLIVFILIFVYYDLSKYNLFIFSFGQAESYAKTILHHLSDVYLAYDHRSSILTNNMKKRNKN